MALQYFSFQGQAYIATKNTNGTPKALIYAGNAPDITLGLDTQTTDHYESTSCNRLLDAQLQTRTNVTFKITLEELLANNLKIALRSTVQAITGASVTNEALTPTGAAVGDYYRTKFTDLSSVVVKDSAGSPATLVANTDYEVSSAKYGRIKLLNVTGFTQPFTVNYTYASGSIYPFFNTAQIDYYIVLELCNSMESNKKYRLELFRTQLKPAKEFALINSEQGKFEIEGAALYDADLGTDANFGNFGRLTPIA